MWPKNLPDLATPLRPSASKNLKAPMRSRPYLVRHDNVNKDRNPFTRPSPNSSGTWPTSSFPAKPSLFTSPKSEVFANLRFARPSNEISLSGRFREVRALSGPHNVGAQLRPAASPRFTKKLSFTRDSRNPEAIPSGVSWSDMLDGLPFGPVKPRAKRCGTRLRWSTNTLFYFLTDSSRSATHTLMID